jgi:translation elongation factor EF-1alpha
LSASIRAGLQKVGFTPAQILGIIPVSIRKGPTNIVSSYTKHNNLMPWYVNQNGPSLEDLLMKAKAPERDKDGPALIVFSKSFKIGGVGTVIVGGIIKGTLEQGNMILAVPGFVKRRAASIEVFHQKVRTAHAGDQVGINMKNISYRDFGRSYRGYLVASAKEKLEFVNTSNGSFFSVANGKLREAGQYAHPEHYIPSTEDAANFNIPRASRAFVADILFVRSKLGKRDTPIQVGSTMTLTCRLMSSHVKVANLIAKLDPKTFKPKEFLPSSLHSFAFPKTS